MPGLHLFVAAVMLAVGAVLMLAEGDIAAIGAGLVAAALFILGSASL